MFSSFTQKDMSKLFQLNGFCMNGDMHVYAQILHIEVTNPSYLAFAIIIDNNDVTYTWEDVLKMSDVRWWGVRNMRNGWVGILGGEESLSSPM